jgi:hypothetical protein
VTAPCTPEDGQLGRNMLCIFTIKGLRVNNNQNCVWTEKSITKCQIYTAQQNAAILYCNMCEYSLKFYLLDKMCLTFSFLYTYLVTQSMLVEVYCTKSVIIQIRDMFICIIPSSTFSNNVIYSPLNIKFSYIKQFFI